jgi:hypothetical protein
MEVSSQFHALAALPQERAPCTHRIGGWVGPRAGMDTVPKRKIPNPRRDLNSDQCKLNNPNLAYFNPQNFI